MSYPIVPAKFHLGQTVITRNALDTLEAQSVRTAMLRHMNGDWGEVCDSDCKSNDHALATEGRLLSVYRDSGGVTFWIITEWDRSVTTVLLPEDY